MTIVVITGPTASGKTALVMALADRLPVRIISADSAMVYREMDIGSAKPDRQTLERYPHALIDLRDPAEHYTVADFVADADAQVRLALAAGQTPVLVGGSMMYIRAFRDGLDAVPRSTPEVREAIRAQARSRGWAALHEDLQRIDPLAAANIHPNNPQRLSRALEVHALTGQPISSFWGQAEGAGQRHGVEVVEFCVDVPSRAVLHERISTRLDEMLADGFVDEVAQLRSRGDLHVDLPSMRAVGYRQVWQHLDGEVNADEMRANVLAATRGLARRQYTWLRKWPHLKLLAEEGVSAQVEALARLAFR